MQGQRTSRWVQVDAWIRAAEARLDDAPRSVAAAMAQLDREQEQAAEGRWEEGLRGSRPALDRGQAFEAAEMAEAIGVGRAAARYGLNRKTLRAAWDRHGIDVTPPGGGRRKRVA